MRLTRHLARIRLALRGPLHSSRRGVPRLAEQRRVPTAGKSQSIAKTRTTIDIVFDSVAADPSFITTGAPAPPTDVVATGVYAVRVDLSWSANKASNVAGYTIYRNVYPAPASPFDVFPWIVLGWLALGTAVSLLVPGFGERLREQLALRTSRPQAPPP